MCGERLYGDTRVFSVKDCTCYYCGMAWEREHGGLSSLSAKHRTNPVKRLKKKKNPLPKLSKAYSQYGASMGRRTVGRDSVAGAKPRLYVQRVRLDSGGYDSGGAYWGHGAALWRISDNDLFETYLRAATREAAKRKVLAEVPGARFYR